MKKVYFFCDHTVPTEHPNAVRFANLGQIFRELGYSVFLVGCDSGEDRTLEYAGMHCTVFHQAGGSGLSNALKREEHQLRYIKDFLEKNGTPAYIVSCLYNCKAQRFLLRYCARNHVTQIKSVCEWFDRSSFAGVTGFFKLINNRYSLRIQIPKAKNVIGISSLLCDYYASRGCNTVYIPTLVDTEEYLGVTHAEDDRIRIAYAGSPARKDYLANAIRAVGLLSDEEKGRLALHLYGTVPEQLVMLGIDPAFLEAHRDTIVCHGRIPYAEVKSRIADADFTVLLRPNKRYANAGFPTKVGESMACGTPVIANITSDLGKYILDGKTGIVCRDETPEACADGFRRALSMTAEERNAMRNWAKEMAANGFDYKNYSALINNFLVATNKETII